MRDASKLILVFAAAASLAACSKPAAENNVAIDINNADPNDIEALPPDESSATPSDQLVNGADNADVNDANTANNEGD
ncbi:MAG TPA: hypothetical protein VF067_05450 [Sphingomicrobium sp.]